MTLLTKLRDAGWREFREGEKWVAERFASRPGATSSIVRVEADSSRQLNERVELRESQLTGTEEPIKDTITDDGTLVTGGQHEALRTEGLTVLDAEQVSEPVPNEDEAKQTVNADSDEPVDPTQGSVNAPQVPADAADQGLSEEAVSASETGSGSADTSTDPSSNAMPASFPPPEGQPTDSLPESDLPAVLAVASSDEEESQTTPDGVDATEAAKAVADEHSVDLTKVEGTGQDGRVLKADVEAAASDEPKE